MPEALSATPAGLALPDQVRRRLRGRALLNVGMPLAILLYLTYTYFAFGVPELIANADPERALILGTDAVAHKVHVVRDLRTGEVEVAVEGERTATWAPGTGPDWVEFRGDVTFVDMGGGSSAEIEGREVRFAVAGYGTVTIRANDDDTIGYELPPAETERPAWLTGTDRRIDVRPSHFKRISVTRTKIELHRYFWGWENFWFPFNSDLHGRSLGELWSLALSGDRLHPERSNAAHIFLEFWRNPDWQHNEVYIGLLQTMMMAVLGTMTAMLASLPLAFLAARNFTPSTIVMHALRRLLDFVRGVDSLIWSLIFIRAFGLGPLTGALAIAVTDTGSLTKLFSEALENVDRKQIEGVNATGASQIQRYRYGVIPQIMPVFLSQSLYYLESNTRSATVIGALGAGGIGLLLVETMRTAKDWENVAYLVVLIIVVVVIMDTLSGLLRRRLIHGGSERAH
jgi:phosphonate transport system permease protein